MLFKCSGNRITGNEGYYTRAAKAIELYILLSYHLKTKGDGVHIAVDNISKVKAEKVVWDDQVPFIKSWLTVQSL